MILLRWALSEVFMIYKISWNWWPRLWKFLMIGFLTCHGMELLFAEYERRSRHTYLAQRVLQAGTLLVFDYRIYYLQKLLVSLKLRRHVGQNFVAVESRGQLFNHVFIQILRWLFKLELLIVLFPELSWLFAILFQSSSHAWSVELRPWAIFQVRIDAQPRKLSILGFDLFRSILDVIKKSLAWFLNYRFWILLKDKIKLRPRLL